MSSEERRDQGISTLAVHAGTGGRQAHASVAAPVYQTATYAFRDTAELVAHMQGEIERLEYGRYGNPTQRAAELKLSGLEGAEDALCLGSGMAAVTTTLFTLLRQGQHLVLTDDCYRRTRQFCHQVLGNLGVEVSVVDGSDLPAVEAAIRPTTRVLLTESPSNPYLKVADLPAMAALKRGRTFKLIVDATFATPVNQRPLAQGADLVIHSGTKYLAGHNDVLAGVVLGSRPLIDGIRGMHAMLGAVVDPHAAWLLIRGLKTLGPRVETQNRSALRIAQFLEAHPKVERVYYPGLESHPSHATAARLMRGFGGVVSAVLRADLEETSRFVDRLRLFQIAPSLGGVESLVEQVALMSYFELTPEDRLELGIRGSLVRLSVGIEDAEDILADLAQALEGT
jgi:cystathionine gamma-synthase